MTKRDKKIRELVQAYYEPSYFDFEDTFPGGRQIAAQELTVSWIWDHLEDYDWKS